MLVSRNEWTLLPIRNILSSFSSETDTLLNCCERKNSVELPPDEATSTSKWHPHLKDTIPPIIVIFQHWPDFVFRVVSGGWMLPSQRKINI